MKRVYQTKKEEEGDCLRACVASILELPLRSVPHFGKKLPLHDGVGQLRELNKWLAGRGLVAVDVGCETNFPLSLGSFGFGEYWIFGLEERGTGYAHAVVGMIIEHEGNADFVVVHDPNNRNGVEQVKDASEITSAMLICRPFR